MKSILFGDIRPDLQLEESLPDIFRTTCKAYPDSIALVFKDKKITYRELDIWSDLVAFQIQKNQISKGKIAVYLSRGLELHVAILGILKSGCSYVAIDGQMPVERALVIMEDVSADGIFTERNFAYTCPRFDVPELNLTSELSTQISQIKISPEDLAYILYTSGSTGKPKGIPITHRQICHLIRAEESIFKLTPQDVVYQGFSISFDMWLEETWITYLAGAKLVISDETTNKSLDELGDFLRKNEVTILHAVPSLLTIIDNDIPRIRIVNAGGEACNENVIKRWKTPNRKIFNTYGPTETTVTATITELDFDKKIDIGKPLPNYSIAIVDENLNPVEKGLEGELVISGIGVGIGYINLPNETAKKFVEKPESLKELLGDKIYRSGDIGFIKNDGNIELIGRIDSQIKIRGYRVELGDIETKLQNIKAIQMAVVALKKIEEKDELVAYLLIEDGHEFNEKEIRKILNEELPSYMVPSHIMKLDVFPRLPSGKIDLKSLPKPVISSNDSNKIKKEDLDGKTVDEKIIIILKHLFPEREINLNQDFFTDLGGHSLLAASFVSYLRSHGDLPKTVIRDIYSNRPLTNLSSALTQKNQEKITDKKADFAPISKLKFYLCWIAQSFSLIAIYGLFALQIFLPYLSYYYVQQDFSSHGLGIAAALLCFAIMPTFFIALTIIAKWLIIGRYKAGEYPLWGTYYFRFWLVNRIQNLVMTKYLGGTPLYQIYLKLLGAKISSSAQLSEFKVDAEDLIEIGKNTSIATGADLSNAVIEDGLLKIGRITIKNNVYIGNNVVIESGSVINDYAKITDLSYVQKNSIIGIKEVWQGNAAQKIAFREESECISPKIPDRFALSKSRIFFLPLLFILPLLLIIPLTPGLVILNDIDSNLPAYDFSYLIFTPLIALLYIFSFILTNAIITRFLLKNIQPGKYPIYSTTYLKKWLVDQIQSLSLFIIYPLYASVYVSPFLRLLGAKIGKGAEISTANNLNHNMLEIGSGAFIADNVSLGEMEVFNQEMILEKTAIGNNSFVGNSALIPQGYALPDNMLVGLLALPPKPAQLAAYPEVRNWFGIPTIAMPGRDKGQEFPASLTTSPSKLRYLFRAIIEALRIVMPIALMISVSVIFIGFADDLIRENNIFDIAILFPLYYLSLIAIPILLIVLALKWLLIGRYKPSQIPMWTFFVWKSEAITTFYEGLCVPFFLEYLKGTPWLPIVMRLFGVKIGKRVFMDTTDITEFDMVKIGDDSILNENCGPQTHLFEDRIMKIGKVEIGSRCTIGCNTIILYDTIIGDNVYISPLSLVMKGERIMSNSKTGGNPV